MATSVGKVVVLPHHRVWKVLEAEPTLDYNYGWLCFTEWHYFKDQTEQPDSEWSQQEFHRGMQHYLFA